MTSSAATTTTTVATNNETTTTTTPTPPPTIQATEAMCYCCFDGLWNELVKVSKQSQLQSQSLAPIRRHGNDDTNTFHLSSGQPMECPLFVTWEKRSYNTNNNSSRRRRRRRTNSNTTNENENGTDNETSAAAAAVYELRGCIGSLTPQTISVPTLHSYAVSSARRDTRFPPVAPSVQELSQLRVSVSLLVQYEPCRDCTDWIVGVHGIIISFSDAAGADGIPTSTPAPPTRQQQQQQQRRRWSATFLPDVAREQGWDQSTTIAHLVRKTGYPGDVTDELRRRLHCQRYQSSKRTVTCADYIRHCVPPAVAAAVVVVQANDGTDDDDGDDDDNRVDTHKLIQYLQQHESSTFSDDVPNNCDIM